MTVRMVEVVVTVYVLVTETIGMLVFVLVKRNFEFPVERVRYAAQRPEAWKVLAAFKTRNHRLGHAEPSRELLLCFSAPATQRGELVRELRCKIERGIGARLFSTQHSVASCRLRHTPILAYLLCFSHGYCRKISAARFVSINDGFGDVPLTVLRHTWQTSLGMKRLLLLVTVLLSAAVPVGAAKGPAVILATTTSTQDTGLLDVLVPAFERSTGYEVKTIAVGTGAALAMGEKGDADVLLVHAPKAEEQFMADGRGVARELVMHNRFIVVGPREDPARVKGAGSAVEAFKHIAAADVPFVSRADDSGTNKKELELWKAADATPKGRWYIKSGSGMADTLHIASQKSAYTLTDDGTFLSQRSTLDLVPEVEDANDLRNVYHVIVVKPVSGRISNLNGAQAFAKYVVSAEGQQLIASFGKERFGRSLFSADAAAVPAGVR